MEPQKKVWEEPQLIVLSRGTPEESVLTHCKYINAPILAPLGAKQNGCNELLTSDCGNCLSRSGS